MKAAPLSFLFFLRLEARSKYPAADSSTCCQGLVDLGFLIITFLFFDHDFTQSGINRFSDQSPPPITFPALAIPINTFVFYPFPATDAHRQADASSLFNEGQHKTIAEGLGSYHTTLLLEQPHKNEALNLASLLPLFNKLPVSFTEKYLRKLYKKKNNTLIKFVFR